MHRLDRYSTTTRDARGERREPSRTHAELCEEFGISTAQLNGYMRRFPFPVPAFIIKTSSSGLLVSWYPHKVAQKWWAEVQEKINGQK